MSASITRTMVDTARSLLVLHTATGTPAAEITQNSGCRTTPGRQCVAWWRQRDAALLVLHTAVGTPTTQCLQNSGCITTPGRECVAWLTQHARCWCCTLPLSSGNTCTQQTQDDSTHDCVRAVRLLVVHGADSHASGGGVSVA
jgi:hypothetical protein